MRFFRTDRRGNPIHWRQQSRPKQQRRRPTVLHLLVQNRAWNDVIQRARTHAHEVTTKRREDDSTALHLACRLDPPPQVVEALHATALYQNAEGCTPLHIAAANRCSKQVVEILLRPPVDDESTATTARSTVASYPTGINRAASIGTTSSSFGNSFGTDTEALSTTDSSVVSDRPPAAVLTRQGRAPIHYACASYRGLRLDAFRVLLEATLQTGRVALHQHDTTAEEDDLEDLMEDVEVEIKSLELLEPPPVVWVNVVACRDKSGQTPLGLLFYRYKERVRLTINTMERWRREGRGASRLAAALTIHAELGELWEKARCIVTRLTEERMPQRYDDEYQNNNGNGNNTKNSTRLNKTRIGNIIGGNADDGSYEELLLLSNDDADSGFETESPGEQAVALEAAKWAVEQHTPSHRGPLVKNRRRRPFQIVHASVGLTGYGCPPEMIRLAVSIHPDQVREMDDDGNLPLHIACMAPSLVSNSALLDDDSVSILSDLTFWSNTTAATTSTPNAFDKVISILLQQYPAAARIPHGRSGKLPLVLAWDRRTWNDGIHTLLNAYPAALETRKPVIPAGLYPHIVCRLGRTTTVGTDATRMRKKTKRTARALTAVYDALKAKPSLFLLPTSA